MAWLQRRAQVLKESWERILLEELFVFSGGLERQNKKTWLMVAGWIPNKDTRQRHSDRAGVLLEDGRVSLSLVSTDQRKKSFSLQIPMQKPGR